MSAAGWISGLVLSFAWLITINNVDTHTALLVLGVFTATVWTSVAFN